MSASDKKKLRKEQNLAQLTERQQAQQKEAKQLKRNTVVFVTVVALVLCIGIGLIAYNWYASSGLPERTTTAVEIGGHKLSAAELNYYYIDVLNQLSQDWYSTYLLQQEGLKTTIALDQQQYKDEVGKTWGDHFVDEAIKEAAGVLALCDEAAKAGHTLSADEKATIEETMVAIETQAELGGWSSLNQYLQAMYGKGAQEKTFRTYLENVTLAQSYYAFYTEGLEYTDEDISKKDAETPGYFSAFDYTYYTLAAEDFIEHAEDAEEEHAHSEEELAEALKKAEEIAKELVASGATNKEELDKAIANLEMYKTEESTEENAEESTEATTEESTEATTEESTEATTEESTEATTGEDNGETVPEDAIEQETENSEEDGTEEVEGEETEEETEEETSNAPTSSSRTEYDYAYIPTEIAEWLAAEGRKVGEIGYVAYHDTDDEGEPTEDVLGYYVVILDKEDKHEENLRTVRHILVEFEGGTTDEESGETVYSDTEKKAASDEAERIKAEFEAGNKTEEAFAELAKKYSDDNAEDGGLYEDVHPGQMVESFEDWCYDESRKAGDVGVVESPYGYHVMYFVEKQEETYRELLITSELRAHASDEWFVGLQDGYMATAKISNTSYQNTSIVLSN